MRLDQALEEFVVVLEGNGRSGHTVAQYQRHVRAFAAFVGADREVDQVTVAEIAKFLTSPAALGVAKPKKPTSVNALRTSIRVFCRYLHEASLTTTNAARLVRRARCSTPPPRGLTADETERLLDLLARAKGPTARRDEMLVRMLLATGLRLGSALAIDVADIDWGRAEIAVRVAKNQAPDRVFVSAELADRLRKFVDGGAHGPLFVNRDRARVGMRNVQRRLERWMAKAGVRPGLSAHSLRHTMAMKLYRATRDIALVQHALKHRNISSTTVYARASDEDLRAAIG